MPATVPFATLDELKVWIEVGSGVTSYDTRLHATLNAACGMIETVCRQRFAAAERVEYSASRDATYVSPALYGDNESGITVSGRDQTITLRSSPVDVSQPFAVSYDLRRRFEPDTVLHADCYTVLDPEAGLVALHIPTRSGLGALRISYTGGYAVGADGTLSDSIPEALKQGALWQAMFLYNKVRSVNIGLDRDRRDSDKGGGAKFVVQGGLVPEAMALVAPFRRGLLVGAS